MLPLLPPTLVYAGYCLRNLESRLYVQVRERTQRNLLLAATFAVVVPNIAAGFYFSTVHQVQSCVSSFCHGCLTFQFTVNARREVRRTLWTFLQNVSKVRVQGYDW